MGSEMCIRDRYLKDKKAVIADMHWYTIIPKLNPNVSHVTLTAIVSDIKQQVTRVGENSYQGNSRRFETKHVTEYFPV